MLRTWEGKRIRANGFKSIQGVKAQFTKAGHVPGTVAELQKDRDGNFFWVCSCGDKLRFTKEGQRFNRLCTF